GPPGTACIRVNVTRLTTSRTGMIQRTRRIRYRVISVARCSCDSIRRMRVGQPEDRPTRALVAVRLVLGDGHVLEEQVTRQLGVTRSRHDAGDVRLDFVPGH